MTTGRARPNRDHHRWDTTRDSGSWPVILHRAIEQGLAVAAAGRGGSAGRSLPLKENHDLRGADGPHTRHREAADAPPALGRIAVERVLQGLWTELAAPPAVFLRQHLISHGLSTSLKRPANGDFYGIPTRTQANVKHQLAGECQASPGTRQHVDQGPTRTTVSAVSEAVGQLPAPTALALLARWLVSLRRIP